MSSVGSVEPAGHVAQRVVMGVAGVLARAARADVEEAGSQCQRQRPSSPSRRFLARPDRSFGRGRCGWYDGDRVGGVLEGGEPVLGVGAHELEDAVHAGLAPGAG